MKYLLIKLRRDVMSMWPQFLSIFLMALLAITVYTGMEGVWYGLENTVDKYYEETKLGDAWVYGSGITDDMEKAVNDIEHVKVAQRSMKITVESPNEGGEPAQIDLMAVKDEVLFKPHIVEGEDFAPKGREGIWIDYDYARANDLQVGDVMTILIGGREHREEVKGLILHAEYIYFTGSLGNTIPDHERYGYALISIPRAEELFGTVPYNLLRVKMEDHGEIESVRKSVEKIFGDSYYFFLEREDLSATSQVTKEIHQMQNMSGLFSAVFILLVLLCIYTTMLRMISVQTTQIGTLKAIGFADGMVRLHYVLYGIVVSICGCLIGIVLGLNIVSSAVMRIKQATMSLPEWRVLLSPITLCICLGIVLIAVFASLMATGRRLNKLPAETLRGEIRKSLKHKDKPSGFSGMSIPFEWKWISRDIGRNKARWIMGVIGVVGSVTLMMAGLGLKNSIDFSNDYVYDHQYTYGYRAELVDNRFSSALQMRESGKKSSPDLQLKGVVEGDYAYLMESGGELYGENEKREMGIIMVLDDNRYIHLEDTEYRPYLLSKSGAGISRKMAENLDLEEGDIVGFRLNGQRGAAQVRIDEILACPSPQGIILSRDLWENLDLAFVPNTILMGEDQDIEKVRESGVVKNLRSIKDQKRDMEEMTESVKSIIYLMIIGSMILSVVILYNLGMLNFMERYREFATMKVNGFYQREIRNIIILENLFTVVVGLIAGIPVGYWFLRKYIGIIQFKSFEWVPTLTKGSLIGAVVLIILVSLLVDLILAHKVKKVDMVEALKSTD